MANTVNVTACDNELIILAYQWGGSYELCRILSGNSKGVAVTLNIKTGQYTGPMVLNGVQDALSVTLDVYLDSGAYSLQLLGINWGSAQQFTVGFNGQTYSLPLTSPGNGLVFSPAPIPFTV